MLKLYLYCRLQTRRGPLSVASLHESRRTLVMDSFLRSSKDQLKSAEGEVTIVAGNESCDLDSMTSAILFAWFRSKSTQGVASPPRRYVPLLNIPKEDIKLRPEFQTLLEQCHIDVDNLITLTDLPSPEILSPKQTQWILVDHNKLDSHLEPLYGSRVVGCIDHHDEENSVTRDIESEPRVIEKCGSCTSIVLREIAASLLDKNADLKSQPKYDSSVLKLGLASILIDTHNLQDANKTKKVDRDIVASLDKILSARSVDWNRDMFFREIDASKKNLDGLSFNDILRKDYKQWTEGDTTLGMSSVVRDLDFLDGLLKEGCTSERNLKQHATAASKFMEKRKLDVWAVMTTYSAKEKNGNEAFQRQLRLHWCNEKSKALIDKFEERYHDELKLELLLDEKSPSDTQQDWKTWRQHNVAASRKQVAPMLRNIMKQYSKI